jgi:hypothetical protein
METPVLKYPDEYLEAKPTLTPRIWTILHQRLCDDDSENVVDILKLYLKAFARRKEAAQDYDDLSATPCGPYTSDLQMRWTAQCRLRKKERDAQWSQDVVYRELLIVMLGQETVDREQLADVDDDYTYDSD